MFLNRNAELDILFFLTFLSVFLVFFFLQESVEQYRLKKHGKQNVTHYTVGKRMEIIQRWTVNNEQRVGHTSGKTP